MDRRRYEDEDDEKDHLPRRKRRGYDEEEDRDEQDDEDGRRVSTTKPGLATAAGVLWLIWGVFCIVATLIGIVRVVLYEMNDDSELPPIVTPTGFCSAFFTGLVALICGLGAILTLMGKVRSLAPLGILSILAALVQMIVSTLMGLVVGIELDSKLHTRVAMRMAMTSLFLSALLMSGVLLAGLFALAVNHRYREWKRIGNDRRHLRRGG